MVKFKGSGKKVSLIQSLDNKVSDLIYRMLDEKSLAKQRNREQNTATCSDKSEDAFSDISLACDLQFNEVMGYVQSKDLSLQRVKKVILERTVDRVLKQVIEDEKNELGDIAHPEELESPSVEVGANEMIAVDTNDMNRSITKNWQVSSAPPTPNTIDTDGSIEKESKKNSAKKRPTKEASGKTKRQKMYEDRSPPTADLSSLGGMEDVVAQLMEVVGLPILHPEIFASTGVEPPRGILLHGPPGCGKTSIANALAGELQVPFISISAPSVVSGMSGESEKKIRELFEEAKSLAPCLVFFDEIDAITPKRDGGAQREMERRIVAQLLTSMDELSFEKTGGKPIIVIGATNRPDALDAALRRAGRFDREICLNVPNETSRIHILKKLTSRLKIDGNIDFVKLAKLTPGFVGADLKALATAAGTCAIKRIFQDYATVPDDSEMDLDTEPIQNQLKNTADIIEPLPLSTVQKFLRTFPEPLTDQQLQSLSIKYEDFLKALPTIQPTAKREGFATVPDVTWSNVGALSKIRIELNMAIVQPIKRPELYEKVGISAPAGVLLWGPPGCGKTLLAKAVANESRANFISIKGPELLNKYVGESERAIRQVFTRARASVPCIIFFDELDALVPRRDTSLSESSSRVVNTLLTELDGLNDRRGIFVIGATNRPDMIDPAMLRPGRLDKTLLIELPDETEKLDIIRTLLRSNGTPLSPDVDLAAIISDSRCRNFSGADLAALVRESSVSALKRKFFSSDEIHSVLDNNLEKEFDDLTVGVPSGDVLVTMQDFELALRKIKPSVSDRDRSKYNRLGKKMGWNDDVEFQGDGDKAEKNEPLDN
ncbi:HFR039Cp [Eremothecium sinecaudum]|uniref:HFR039Cp n=1 Tax=Eremothecium sinecaudum TaxID=45286 RepID=A0A0X8HUY3_9SACH|nr:HFR039Cp [Eremothecium sinecaudum]AMD21894.1 HFR039Cp [Eremothecium sinecaudum]